MWDKYLYNRLSANEKALIDKVRLSHNKWKQDHTKDYKIIKCENPEIVKKNIDLLEVQLYSLLKQLNFNRHLYVKEMKVFSEYPPRKHLEVCVKSFHLSTKEVLHRHGVELLIKIQPLERQLFDDLSEEDQKNLNKIGDEIWGPFYIVNSNDFSNTSTEWPMTVGKPLLTPVRVQLQQWLAPWVALTVVATGKTSFATSGSCADAAQKYLMDWEESIIQIILKQIKEY